MRCLVLEINFLIRVTLYRKLRTKENRRNAKASIEYTADLWHYGCGKRLNLDDRIAFRYSIRRLMGLNGLCQLYSERVIHGELHTPKSNSSNKSHVTKICTLGGISTSFGRRSIKFQGCLLWNQWNLLYCQDIQSAHCFRCTKLLSRL